MIVGVCAGGRDHKKAKALTEAVQLLMERNEIKWKKDE